MPGRTPIPSFRIAAVLLLAAASSACRDQLPGPAITPTDRPAAAGAAGNLQYFGYVGSGDNWGLALTKGFTNFAHADVSANLTEALFRDRVDAIAQRGLKATIDLGKVFWCDYAGDGSYRFRCTDWQSRWATWKAYNASIFTPEKVLAVAVMDEPFKRNANMAHYEEVVARVKADFPWVKVFLFEAACLVRQECGSNPQALAQYQGTLPGVDWITVGEYAIKPLENQPYLAARGAMKSRFPGKQWLYVMDGYWSSLHTSYLSDPYYSRTTVMQTVARQWYDMARADPSAVLLGVFTWGPPVTGWKVSRDFLCAVLLEHVAMGRAITNKPRTNAARPVGIFERIDVDVHGYATAVGWATDPDATLCEHPPVDVYVGGQFVGTAEYPATAAPNSDYTFAPQSGTGYAWRWRIGLPLESAGQPVTAVARDLDAGSTALPSECPETPACHWSGPEPEP